MLILPAFLNVGVLANNLVGQDGDPVTEMKVERHRTTSSPGLQGTDEENEIIGKEYTDCYRPEFSPVY